MQVSNLDDYNKIFLNLEANMQRDNVKLLVVDNILTVCDYFIKTDGSCDFFERANFLVAHSRKLKRLAYQNNMVIIIMNNVVADVERSGGEHGFFEKKDSRGQPMVPSLGLLWSNCINERIGIKKRGNAAATTEVKRTMQIEKSSYMRKNEIDFVIMGIGLRGKH